MGVKGARAGVRAGAGERVLSLKQRRETFLAHFAANCNVRTAAAAADVPLSTVYLWRRCEPGFADEWRAAVSAGYEMLEARLVGHALAGGARSDDVALDGIEGTLVEPLNIELALKLLAHKRPGKSEPVRRGRPPARPVTRETLMTELLRRIETIEKHRRAKAARLAARQGAVQVIEHQPQEPSR